MDFTALWIIAIVLGVIGLFILIKCTCFRGPKNSHLPDCTGKIVVITGGNTGLGYIAAQEIAMLKPQKLILACRDETRGKNAVNAIKRHLAKGKDFNQEDFHEVEYMPLDLNDLASVKAFADAFNAKYDKLDILMNNAGIMALPTREETKQGFEKQIGVNHFGHFLLTKLLMDKIKASNEGRIVNVSSMAHTMKSNKLNFDDLHFRNGGYKDWDAYAASKLANVYFTRELAKRLTAEGCTNVKVCSLHPGVVRTELGRNMSKFVICCMGIICCPCIFMFTLTPWRGAQTQLHCALVPFADLAHGMYYDKCKVVPEKLTADWENQAKQLYEVSEEAVKEFC